MANWDDGCSSATSRFLFNVLHTKVLAELDQRGYDLTTLRFQIRKKTPGVLDQLARIGDA